HGYSFNKVDNRETFANTIEKAITKAQNVLTSNTANTSSEHKKQQLNYLVGGFVLSSAFIDLFLPEECENRIFNIISIMWDQIESAQVLEVIGLPGQIMGDQNSESHV